MPRKTGIAVPAWRFGQHASMRPRPDAAENHRMKNAAFSRSSFGLQ